MRIFVAILLVTLSILSACREDKPVVAPVESQTPSVSDVVAVSVDVTDTNAQALTQEATKSLAK